MLKQIKIGFLTVLTVAALYSCKNDAADTADTAVAAPGTSPAALRQQRRPPDIARSAAGTAAVPAGGGFPSQDVALRALPPETVQARRHGGAGHGGRGESDS